MHESNHSDDSASSSTTDHMEAKFLSVCSHLFPHEHTLTEIFIHQLIETIEFVLGSVSNTASYLWLWALSLAHSQLAEIFFEKTIGFALEKSSGVMLFLAFPIFFSISFFVLFCMDTMECFLHTLRLHWVEF